MPKMKPGPDQRRSEILSAWQRYMDYSDERAARTLGITRSTLYRRMKNGDWKLSELHRAIRMFRIPPEDALEMLAAGCVPLERHMERLKKRERREAG